MIDLILQIVLMLSLGTIVYISALAIPKMGEAAPRPNKIRDWVKNLPYHHIDEAIDAYKDKILRKSKIVVMKIENFINKNLNKDKDQSGPLGGPQA